MNKEGIERESKMAAHGTKARISPVVSQLFRSIGSEMTEMICIKVPGNKDGRMVTRLVSKAEALVRDLYQTAMPVSAKDLESMDIKEVAMRSKGQMDARKLILGYTIDKKAKEDSGDSVPDKVSELNKDAMNKLAIGNSGETTCGTTQKKKKGKKSKCPTVPLLVQERKTPGV